MSDLTVNESKALVNVKNLTRLPVYIIAKSPTDASSFALYVGLSDQQYEWIAKPEDLAGKKRPMVFILPNWWMHNYAGMEAVLQQTQANIKTVHYGRKPNYKNRPFLIKH